MKVIIKLVLLVILLVPVWITFLTFTGKSNVNRSGALVVVEQALQNSNKDLRVSDVLHFDPAAQPEAWKLTALATAGKQADGRPFVSEMRMVCPRPSDSTCWAVDRLDFPVIADASMDVAPQAGDLGEDTETQRLMVVQQYLTKVGFDLGPQDGRMGPRTEQAIKDYVATKDPSATDSQLAQALVDIEIDARLERAEAHRARGDIWKAINEYAKVSRLGSTDGDVHLSRAVIYHGIGLPELAITAYDEVLGLDHKHAMAYHGRGNARFDRGEYWTAFADHADGFGVRLLGDGYLVMRDHLREGMEKVAPEFEAMLQWAEETWVQAKDAVADKVRPSNEENEEEAT